MRYLVIFCCILVVTACSGKVAVESQGGNVKHIELSDVPRISWPPQLSYTHPESQATLVNEAVEACPGGYKKLSEQYVADNGKGTDAMIWKIKCNTP